MMKRQGRKFVVNVLIEAVASVVAALVLVTASMSVVAALFYVVRAFLGGRP